MSYGVKGLSDGFLAGFSTGNQFYNAQRANDRADKRMEMEEAKLGIQQEQQAQANELHAQTLESNDLSLWKQKRDNSKAYITDWANNAASSKSSPDVSYELIHHMNNVGMDISSLLPEENAKYMTTAQHLIDDKISYQSPEAVALAKSIYEKELNAELLAKGGKGRREVTGIVPTPNGTLALEVSRYDENGKLVSKSAPVTDQGQVQGSDNVVMFDPDKAMKRLIGRNALSKELIEKSPELQQAWRAKIEALRTNKKAGYTGIILDEKTGMAYQRNIQTGEIHVLQQGDKDILKSNLGISLDGGKDKKSKGFALHNFDGAQYRVNKDTGTTDIYDNQLNQWVQVSEAGQVQLVPDMQRMILAESEVIDLTNAEQATYKNKDELAKYRQYKAAQELFPGTDLASQLAKRIGFTPKETVSPVKSFKAADEALSSMREKLRASNPQLAGMSDSQVNKLILDKHGKDLERKLPGLNKYTKRLTEEPKTMERTSHSTGQVLSALAKFKQTAATTDIQMDDKVKAKLARIGELERILNSPAPKPDMTRLGIGFSPDQLTSDPRLAVSELASLLQEFGAL